jgi:hypothetical protein
MRLRAWRGKRAGLSILRRLARKRRSTVLRDVRQGLRRSDRAATLVERQIRKAQPAVMLAPFPAPKLSLGVPGS